MIHIQDADWTTGHLPGQVCGVPGHLRNMFSPDPTVRTEVFEDLYAEVHDQGAVDRSRQGGRADRRGRPLGPVVDDEIGEPASRQSLDNILGFIP